MIIFIIILGIYIGMVMLSLLGPYIEFRKNHCEKGKKYTLEDLRYRMDDFYWIMCFMPVLNVATIVVTLVSIFIIPLWNKIKRIRIV